MSPRVRLEPLGEELDCAAHETVLDAAFRQGYNLAYGCREGQCSACKCYLLAGAVALNPERAVETAPPMGGGAETSD